jgi:hypothetical protein
MQAEMVQSGENVAAWYSGQVSKMLAVSSITAKIMRVPPLVVCGPVGFIQAPGRAGGL